MTVTPSFHFRSSVAAMLYTSAFVVLLASVTLLSSSQAAATSIAKAAERMSATGDEMSEGEALQLLRAVTALDAYYRHRADAINNKQQLQQPFVIPTAARFIRNTQHQQPIYAGQPMMKRSMALGRLEFRPGKRSGFAPPVQQAAFEDAMVPLEMLYATNYFRDSGHPFPAWVTADALRQQQQENDDDAEAENSNKDLWWYAAEESAMGKRAAAAAKRSMAVGRSGFRPGKRSIATGREGFRPGK